MELAQETMFLRSYADEVLRVDAARDPTEVMHLHPLGNGADFGFVDESMRASIPLSEIDLGIPPRATISLARRVSKPVMAWGVVTHVAKLPVLEFLHASELSMNVSCGEEGWLSATAKAECCFDHKDNTINMDTMSPKEGSKWQ